ncbi:hypothetical protein SAMN05421805_104147 [Saccharopolyspora antimicrobica]|uniref:Uncharacterized protein n=1 Tax=Saccharopolyspora antimicrobica TaxID=455193 RepID=A0A1I4YHF9_9PSEU|nr:hypothetical protein [Saccharopolyspora antimicrobica]RKT82677.1 hypothetical protein ATL45_0931 [Saccharopolyspora antimicrobica]SFN37446.1 hypothetical protein SAMN05421805_104147 [Saccharopolyspora antimicrobica]
MFSSSRKIAVAVAGLAVMLGAGGVAFATTGDAPTDGGKPAAIECRKVEHLEPGVPFEPAKPVEVAPAKPLEPGTPAVPAKPIEEAPTEPLEPGVGEAIECRQVDGPLPGVPSHPTEPGAEVLPPGAPGESAEQAEPVK